MKGSTFMIVLISLMSTWVTGNAQSQLGSSRQKVKASFKDSSEIVRVIEGATEKECGYLAYIFRDSTVVTYQFKNDSCCLYLIEQGIQNAPIIKELMDRNYTRIAPNIWFDSIKSVFWHLQIDTNKRFSFVYASYTYLDKGEYPPISDKKLKSMLKLIK